MTSHRAIVRSAGLIGFFTGLSRVLGFVRDMVIAAAFGTGIGAEAFVVSFRIPNLLRDLVGEGAANAAIVPVLTEVGEKDKKGYWPLVATLFWIMTLVLIFLSVLGILLAPVIVRVMVPGFALSTDQSKFPLTVMLTQAIFPYIFLIGLSALAMGVLNSQKEFTSSAIGPALLNVCMILAGIFFEKRYGPMALVGGVLAGGVLQLIFQIPPLIKRGFRLYRPKWKDPAVRRIGKLLIPRAMGSALYQVNIFVDSILASFESIVGPGGQSALYYSNRLFQLPLAIIGLSLAQAVLPTFSSQIVQKDYAAFKKTFEQTVRSMALLIVPAAVALAVWARPIVRVIFEHGRFDSYSTHITSGTLFFYTFGLFSCCLIKVLANAFYAMHDTRTPVKMMTFAVVINIALSIWFMQSLKIAGLALASSLSATVNMCLLYARLERRVGTLLDKSVFIEFLKILGASVLMGFLIFSYDLFILARLGQEATRTIRFLVLFGGILAGLISYFIGLKIFRVRRLRELLPFHGHEHPGVS